MLCRIIEYPAKSASSEFIYGTRTAEFLRERISSVLISGKIIWEKKAVSCENNLFVQNRSTIIQNMETWQKSAPFLQNISHRLILPLASISFRTEKGRHAFEEEENEILQRNIEENSNNIVQNQEQVAVSSIASVVKTSTSLYSSGKSRISNKNSSSGSREWTHNEIIELIAIWKEKEALYKTSRLFY